jgi:hypothetical protein
VKRRVGGSSTDDDGAVRVTARIRVASKARCCACVAGAHFFSADVFLPFFLSFFLALFFRFFGVDAGRCGMRMGHSDRVTQPRASTFALASSTTAHSSSAFTFLRRVEAFISFLFIFFLILSFRFFFLFRSS